MFLTTLARLAKTNPDSVSCFPRDNYVSAQSGDAMPSVSACSDNQPQISGYP